MASKLAICMGIGMELEKIIEILEDLHPELSIRECVDLFDGKRLDSFDLVALLAEIYDVFDVQIPPEALNGEHFNSAEAITELIHTLRRTK